MRAFPLWEKGGASNQVVLPRREPRLNLRLGSARLNLKRQSHRKLSRSQAAQSRGNKCSALSQRVSKLGFFLEKIRPKLSQFFPMGQIEVKIGAK